MKSITDPQAFSKLTFSLLANNVVTPNAMKALAILEGIFTIMYTLLYQQQMLRIMDGVEDNIEDERQHRENEDSHSISLRMDFFTEYTAFVNIETVSLTIISMSLLALFILLFVVMIILLAKGSKENINSLKAQRVYLKIIGVIFTIFGSALYIPLIDIIARSFFVKDQYSLGLFIAFEVLLIVTLMFYFMLLFYVRRFYKLNMPSMKLCGSTNSSMIYLSVLVQVIAPVVLATDQEGAYVFVEIIVTFLIYVGYNAMSIIFPQDFNSTIDLIKKMSSSLTLLILEYAVIQYLFHDLEGKEGIYLIVLFGFQCYFIYQVKAYFKKNLINKFKCSKIERLSDYEYLLICLIELYYESQANDNKLAEILHLLEDHQISCQDTHCFCNKTEYFVDLFKECESQQSNIFMIDIPDFKQIKDIIKGYSDKKIKSSIQKLNAQVLAFGRDEDQKFQSKQVSHKDEANRDLTSAGNKRLIQKTNKALRVEISDLKEKFVSHVLLIFFRQIASKYPNNLNIHLLMNYFSAFIVKKPQQCLANMRGFNENQLTWMNKVTKQINKFYLLTELNIIQGKNQVMQDQTIDGEHFIKINHQFDKFFATLDLLTQTTIEYWKLYNNDELKPLLIQNRGESLAKEISCTYKMFKDIENTLIQKDYRLYYWFANVQKKILNDNDAYLIFYNKMKSVIQLNKLYVQNSKNLLNSEDAGFILTDGHSQTYGKTLFINKVMKSYLKRENEDLKFMNINSIMPKIIEDHHDQFMKSYNATGDSLILNKKLIHFIKDKHNALIPVEVFIKLHYSQIYKYCFVTLFNPITKVTPFRDNQKYDTDQLIFMTINMDDSMINETSENFIYLLQALGIGINDLSEISFLENQKYLTDILKDFDFDEVRTFLRSKVKTGDFYEGIHQVDLSPFNELDWNLRKRRERLCEMKVSIFYEQYGKEKIELGIVVLTLCNQSVGKHPVQLKRTKFSRKSHRHYLLEELNNNEDDEEDGSIASSSAGSQSASTSSNHVDSIEQFNSYYRQQTPRMLKIVMQMILFMATVSITIASINLGINITSQIRTIFEIRTVRASIDRVNYSINNILMMRTLLNMANGYEPFSSNIVPDRWPVYKDLQTNKINQLKEAESYLQNSGYTFTGDFLTMKESPVIKLTELNSKNQENFQMATMAVTQSLYISNLVQLNSASQSDLKGNLDIQTLKPNTSTSYSPTQTEKSIYFVIINGISEIQLYNWMFADAYMRDTQSLAKDSFKNAQTTTIISIVVIFVVAMIISPIISKTEERKFQAIRFFLKIPKDQIQLYIEQCKECIDMIEGTKQSDKNHNKKEHDQLEFNELAVPESMLMSQSNFNNSSDNEQEQINEEFSVLNDTIQNFSQRPLKNNFDFSSKSLNQNSFYPEIASTGIKHDNDESIIKKKSTFNVRNSILENQSISTNNKPLHLEELKVIDDEHQEELLTKKLSIIGKLAFKTKIKTFIQVILLILVFSIYFVISFLMSQKHYNAAENSSTQLYTIFTKEVCLENLLIYLREDYIRNQTVGLADYGIASFSEFYMTYCSEQEQQYSFMRRNMPSYLKQAEPFLSALESDQFCDVIYVGQHAFLNALCKTAMNGILTKGLTNFMYFMYNYASKLQLNFDSVPRTYSFLYDALQNKDTVELIDTKLYILSHAFEILQDVTMNCVFDYFEKLRNEIIIIYIVFLLLMLISLGYFMIFAFENLKKTMWNTNILLKIIPRDTLHKVDQEKLRNFFVS